MKTIAYTIIAPILAVLLVAPVGGSVWADEAPPPAQVAYSLSDGDLLVTSGAQTTTISLGGYGVALVTHGDRLYVALGVKGVAVYDLASPGTPSPVETIPSPGGSVVGFHVVRGSLWMEIASKSAIPLAEASGAAPPAQVTVTPSVATTEPTTTPGKQPAGSSKGATTEPIPILAIEPGLVELGVGSDDGIKIGHRFTIFRTVSVGGKTGAFQGKKVVAVVTVTAVKGESCLAELGRGMRVIEGDMVLPSEKDEVASLIYPMRLANYFELAGVIRPLVKVGTPLGLGLLADFNFTWFGSSYFAGVKVHPFGLGWTKEGNVVATSILAEGGYDSRAFAVGLGVGVSAINGDLNALLRSSGLGAYDESGAKDEPSYTQETQSVFALAQTVRLGARDGLHLDLFNILLYHEDEGEAGFIYGGTSGKLVVPVTLRLDLFFEGGGGVMGYGYGGVGVFSWLVGNGDVDSLGLSVSAGYAGVWGSKEVEESYGEGQTYTYDEDVDIVGPMVSVGIIYRL